MPDPTTPVATPQNNTGGSGDPTSNPAAQNPAAPAGDPAAAPAAAPAPAGQPTDPNAADPNAPAAAPIDLASIKMPEGMTMDSELGGQLVEFAKLKGLSQEDTQAVADLGVKLMQKQMDTFAQTRAQWTEDAKADPEIGGTAFDQNLGLANKALGAFATAEFIDFLTKSGLSNHPEMIRAWNRVGKAIGEDQLIPGAKPAGNRPSTEQTFYPTMFKS